MTNCNPPISTETLGLPKGSSRVTSYESEWPLRFSEEKDRILNMFACYDVKIHHIDWLAQSVRGACGIMHPLPVRGLRFAKVCTEPRDVSRLWTQGRGRYGGMYW